MAAASRASCSAVMLVGRTPYKCSCCKLGQAARCARQAGLSKCYRRGTQVVVT